jgi:hypothetical protein
LAENLGGIIKAYEVYESLAEKPSEDTFKSHLDWSGNSFPGEG